MLRLLCVLALLPLFAACVPSEGGVATSYSSGPAVVDSCDGEDECAVMVADRPNEVLYFAPGASWAAGPLYTVPWEPGYMLPYRVRYYNGWGGTVVTNTVWRDVAVRRGWNRSVVVANVAPRGVMPYRHNTAIRLSDGRSVAYNNRHSAVHQVRLNQGRQYPSVPNRGYSGNTPTRPPVHAGVTPRPPQHTPPPSRPPQHAAPPSRPPPRTTPPPSRPPQHVTAPPRPAPAPRPAPPPPRRNCGGQGQPKC